MIELVPYYPLAPALFVLAATYFALAMARHLRIFALARPSRPFDRPVERAASLLVYVFGQARMFRDRRAGLMPLAIFYGFLAITVGTASVFSFGLVEAIVTIPLDGALWRLVVLGQNLVSVAVLVAIAYAYGRRLVTHPTRLTFSRDALIILGLIAGVVATGLLSEAFRIAGEGDPYRGWAVVSGPLGGWLAGAAGAEALRAGFLASWWAHAVIVCTFLVYLPGSKHLHIATSFFNVTLRKLGPRGRLPMLELETAERFGVRTLTDLGWKDLLDGFTCTECGRCQAECPAWATGKPLNPKSFIMGIREMAVEAEAGLPLIPDGEAGRAVGLAAGLRPELLERPIVGAAIPYEAVWDCTTCGACVEACPVLIEHVDKIVDLRRQMVLEESRFPAELTAAFRNLESLGNPWGIPRAQRFDWTRDLPFAVPLAADVAAEGQFGELDVLYWVGCAGAFDERNRRVTRAVVACLDAAGVRFAVLGAEETCTGDPARRLGNEYVFQLLAQENIARLDRYGPPTILTACPHCFNTLANEYGQLGGHYRVVHHSQYLARLVREGRLRPAGGDGCRVAFHDPCYLSRYNGIESAPRAVVSAVPGVELVEMERHGRRTFCCGAGGGRMWMEEPAGQRVNEERTRQALASGADVVATACPFCLVMLRDGLAGAADGTDGMQALDLAEVLAGSLEGPGGVPSA